MNILLKMDKCEQEIADVVQEIKEIKEILKTQEKELTSEDKVR